MPRDAVDTYCSRHHQLYEIWTEKKLLLSCISAIKQWEIHNYCLSADNLSDLELRQQFQAVPIYDLSQPNRAGKAYAELLEQIDIQQRLAAMAPVEVTRAQRRRGDASNVRTRVVANPHIDCDKFSRIYFEMADRIVRERNEAKDKSEQY
ncbi:hypothetical protein [Arthrobacter glacialis]|nr:hypothetical protein [Arthrobacter glacialis]